MSTTAKLRGEDFDRMVRRGAFGDLGALKVELINGDLRLMNPAGPVHDDNIVHYFFMEDSRYSVGVIPFAFLKAAVIYSG